MDSEYDHAAPQDAESNGPHPHPYLHEPLLYISNVPPFITDENLAVAFVSCGPFRPKIPRDGTNNVLSGTIEFKFLEKAEKALATLQSRPLPGILPPVPLVLSPYPPTNPPTPLPPPSALPRLVKHLPQGFTDAQLYDLFRPFGALASARTQTHFGTDTGTVEFWNEDDARAAEEAMHCAEIEGQNIAVQVYQQRRTSGNVAEFSVNAPAFVPSGSMFPSYPPQYSPPRAPYPVQLAPLSGPGSTSHSGLIDPCNLFCKNLDPEIDSNGLFTHFRQFGQIVSARVMRNENGESRGFGFVSYQTTDQASAAMHAMNGAMLGSKQVVVRLHEPKQLRQEKLAQRFGHNGHPRSSSGATSPTASEAGESYPGWGSPRHHSSVLGSPNLYERPDRGRRGSGSYYNAALSGTLNLPMRYDDLASLSPVVRKEVLTGELSRRIKALEVVPETHIDAIVDSLVNLSLSEVMQCIEDPSKLKDHATAFKGSLRPAAPSKSPSPAASQDSRLLDPNALNATASAPEHPSTPISVSPALSSPPRTSSPSGSMPPTSERDRMLASISKFESSRQAELTELLMSLPKRERAMCLFNAEVLRAKLADAKMVLDSEDGDEEDQKLSDARSTKSAPQTATTPVTPQTKKHTPRVEDSPHTPDLSSRGPSAASSPLPGTPGGVTHTIASLARLPATEIIKIASSSSATGVPLPKADPLVVQATDEFIDSLLDKPSQVQKQKLGDKLFKVIKSFGVKGAPKVTIALLDQEDLRALAHLMNSYPSVLKEKALAGTPTK
ncbi:Polyadenylate-binding protein, cytoplasmic and nuclear [Hypsizygus marmoreus]|uniref:Polyadenylate-binding protein, cytoplasmic and nuclear n=1 Tax=Hypsizygus marmoreus TaxID=39966 RepID=A0A369KG63_HYPMA|nr:Polyadenylate-binding protein, cytoplasmic and nuclear [Hypsizygus marmoreus]